MAVGSRGRSSVSDMNKRIFFLFRRLLTSEMCHHVDDKESTIVWEETACSFVFFAVGKECRSFPRKIYEIYQLRAEIHQEKLDQKSYVTPKNLVFCQTARRHIPYRSQNLKSHSRCFSAPQGLLALETTQNPIRSVKPKSLMKLVIKTCRREEV